MVIAALIISVIALLLGIASIVWLLAKQFSSHSIQYVDPFKDMKENPLEGPMGKKLVEEFREIGLPLDDDEENIAKEYNR